MANRLAQAQSLYLRKHAENPVDWWPWCNAALATAAQENKPIFLSIGYSSCHWCTVMEGEAFSDSEIADYLNTHFLPIKVDREERPDIDSIYMQALQMMVGQGGWPLNIFLTPDDLVPFYGGTYFPVEPKYGRPGFLQVLQAIRHYFDTEKDKLAAVKAEILDGLQRAVELPENPDLTQTVLVQGLMACARILAPSDYGNSFPMIPYALAVWRGDRGLSADIDATSQPPKLWVQRGLDLSLGGIFDHVAGGFHRYTVDPTWTVPHFEKMLYDNGQIIEYLAELWSAGIQEPAFERAITLTTQWLQREMTAPAGYFYASQDADSFVTPTASEPEEGAFYVWQYETLREKLDESALTALTTQFTVTPAGNFEGQNVLQRRYPGVLNADTEAILTTLFHTRYGVPRDDLSRFPPAPDNQAAKTLPWPGRIPAVTDTKMIVAWNALMISGLARAATVLQTPSYFEQAVNAAQFILTHQWVEGQLQRLNYDGSAVVLAQAEDYALLVKAFLDLHQAAGDWPEQDSARWLAHAVAVQSEFDEGFWCEQGGYTNTASEDRDRLLVQERPYQDSAIPSANGIAIANLVRLALLTEDLQYLERAESALQAFGAVLAQLPRACPSLLAALDWFRHATLVKIRPEYLPEFLPEAHPTAVFKGDNTLPPGVVGMVCEVLFCKAPATSLAQVREQLRISQQRS